MLWTSPQINFNKTANSHTDDRFIKRTSCLLTFHRLFFAQIWLASLSQDLSEDQWDRCVSRSGSVWVCSALLHLWAARGRRAQEVKHLWHDERDERVSLTRDKRIPSLRLLVSAAEFSCNKGASGLLRSGLFGFRQLSMVSWPGLVWHTNTYLIKYVFLTCLRWKAVSKQCWVSYSLIKKKNLPQCS